VGDGSSPVGAVVTVVSSAGGLVTVVSSAGGPVVVVSGGGWVVGVVSVVVVVSGSGSSGVVVVVGSDPPGAVVVAGSDPPGAVVVGEGFGEGGWVTGGKRSSMVTGGQVRAAPAGSGGPTITTKVAIAKSATTTTAPSVRVMVGRLTVDGEVGNHAHMRYVVETCLGQS
jgi:hypothetical protein